jgi:hypothetical protein
MFSDCTLLPHPVRTRFATHIAWLLTVHFQLSYLQTGCHVYSYVVVTQSAHTRNCVFWNWIEPYRTWCMQLADVSLKWCSPRHKWLILTKLLVMSSPQTWCQSIESHDCHLQPGMSLDLIYHFTGLGSHLVWVIPGWLEHRSFGSFYCGWYCQTFSPSWNSAEQAVHSRPLSDHVPPSDAEGLLVDVMQLIHMVCYVVI